MEDQFTYEQLLQLEKIVADSWHSNKSKTAWALLARIRLLIDSTR